MTPPRPRTSRAWKAPGRCRKKPVSARPAEKDLVDAATIVQNMMAEVGVTVDIKVLEYGAYYSALSSGDHDMYMTTWGNNLPDPEYSFSRRFGDVAVLNLR